MDRVSSLLSATVLTSLLTGCFPHAPGPRLMHFDDRAPALGEPAPNFALKDIEGKTVELADFIGEKPVVLRLGSHSCPVYRYRRFSMEDLIEDFRDRVHFLTVYTTEAHPVGSKSPYAEGEWDTWMNKAVGVRVREPATQEEREELARFSHEKLKLLAPMAVDGMDNEVWETYGGASSPGFVIDQQGRVALRQVWIEPKEIREVLEKLVGEEP